MNNKHRKCNKIFLFWFQGLGGSGVEHDESVDSPHKMQWDEAANLKKAALGGQVSSFVEILCKIPLNSTQNLPQSAHSAPHQQRQDLLVRQQRLWPTGTRYFKKKTS